MTPQSLADFGKRLGPVLCRSGAEQEMFKSVYSTYVKELTTLPTVVERPLTREEKWYDRFLVEKWALGLISLLLGGMLGIYVVNKLNTPLEVEVVAEIIGPTEVREGEERNFYNNSIFPGKDSSSLEWEWQIINDQTLEVLKTDSSHWTLSTTILPSREGENTRQVNLTVTDPTTGATANATHSYRVNCATPPPIITILTPRESIEINESEEANYFLAQFDSLELANLGYTRDDFNYQWFLDGTPSADFSNWLFQPELEPGKTHEIKLNVGTKANPDFCTSNFTINYALEQTRVILPIYNYQPVQYEHIAGFRPWWPLTLIALWIGGLFWSWRRWKQEIERKKAEARAAEKKEKEEPGITPAPDAAPYTIPWISQENRLPLEPSQLALARAMRHRAGSTGRKELDAAKTLKATIASGGFPEARFNVRERAGEYVLLIDEVDGLSHQGRLFKRLAKELTRRDVYAEVFYYQGQLNRCWNEQEPHGLNVEDLAVRFGGQRLLVIGSGHDFLDHHASEKPGLTPRHEEWLKAFPDRTLLTPVPPVAWSFEEKVLHRHFSLFPADSRGILEAAAEVTDGTSDDQRDFETHEARQLKGRNDKDPSHIRWRRSSDLSKYFAGRPDLLLWARALAVHPSPNFDLTVAIGRALEPHGVIVNHDNLLELSRWETLNHGHFRRRLREELLKELTLDREAELAARAALAEQLRKAQPAASGGFAARELENVLAVQTFALDHSNTEAKAEIANLIKADALDPDLLDTLNREVALEFERPALMKDPFQSFEENFAQTLEEISPPDYRDDGPEGWWELRKKLETASESYELKEILQLLKRDIPSTFKGFAEQSLQLAERLDSQGTTFDVEWFSNGVTPQVSALLDDIRHSQEVWTSETDLKNFTAATAVDRMISTERYGATLPYFQRRLGNTAPDGFDDRLATLRELLDKHQQNQSPPPLEQKVVKKAATNPLAGNFSKRLLVSNITKLAEDIDQLEKERREQGIFSNTSSAFSNMGESISARAETPDLDTYFADATPPPTEEKSAEEKVAEKVPRPVWWPVLAAISGLLLFLLFIWLYPKHNTGELYFGPKTKQSWLVKEKPPKEQAVLKHQEAVASFQAGNIEEGIAAAREADAASSDSDPVLLLNVLTAVYNYYAERYNDPSKIKGSPDTMIWDILYEGTNYFGSYEELVGRNRSLDYEPLGRMNNNYEHLQALVDEDYAVFNETPINYDDPASPLAQSFYSLKESGYFDTLSYRPNLLTIISKEKSRIVDFTVKELSNNRRGLHISAIIFLSESQQREGTELIIGLKDNNGQVVDENTLLYSLDQSEEWRIEYDFLNENIRGRTDSVVLVLAIPGADSIIDRRIKEFNYRWPLTIGQTQGVGNAPPPEREQQSSRDTASIGNATQQGPPRENSGLPTMPDGSLFFIPKPFSLYFGSNDHNGKTPYSVEDFARLLEDSGDRIVNKSGYQRQSIAGSAAVPNWTNQGDKLRELKRSLEENCNAGTEVRISLQVHAPGSDAKNTAMLKGWENLFQLAIRNDPDLKDCINNLALISIESLPVIAEEYPIGSNGYRLSEEDYRVRRLYRMDVEVKQVSASTEE
ncbi:hypothetical protein [Neolewinella agarilytica]|uniref:Uncharacterized protein n=1 Tax=Neolewinella agarilytica TaxID=478744 RepID=A0A1H9D0I0_9BACT|nr:hypothetical protein [Neolewinella agarilytica]SEQ06268.1 hypothetical protein SAMN05444359_10570 [Neolewinella agarilytica]